MNKSILEQLELERSKRDLIKAAKAKQETMRSERQETDLQREILDADQKFAWEYELERYRKDRLKDRFCIAGAICGFISLILTIWFHWPEIQLWFHFGH
jgi:cell division FtsZ-interacting protein ZapD